MRLQGIAKRLAVFLLLLMMLPVAGCAPARNRYQAVFMDLFDTVTTITGYAADEAAFQQEAQAFHDRMLRYHQMYDIYHPCEGMINLYTLNERAGETIEVSQDIMDLLLFARDVCDFSGGRTDITLGSVLKIWHDARELALEDPEQAALPDADALRSAREHTGFDQLILDEEHRTVRYADPELRLDVGALAKGFATQRAASLMPDGYLVSVGGNVFATGPKADGTAWTVGIENPNGAGADFLDRLSIRSGSVVTSGDYQRYYTVKGKNYHHIIDPNTLYPADQWRAVTVVMPDSGLADALSTTLFMMSREEGEKLLSRFNAEASWLAPDGTEYYSTGFEQYRKNQVQQ